MDRTDAARFAKMRFMLEDELDIDDALSWSAVAAIVTAIELGRIADVLEEMRHDSSRP